MEEFEEQLVLILVILELTLRAEWSWWDEMDKKCLNPCYTGTYASRSDENEDWYEGLGDVLILVILELTLRVPFRTKGIARNFISS